MLFLLRFFCRSIRSEKRPFRQVFRRVRQPVPLITAVARKFLNHPDSALIILPEVKRITSSMFTNWERAFIVIRVGKTISKLFS